MAGPVLAALSASPDEGEPARTADIDALAWYAELLRHRHDRLLRVLAGVAPLLDAVVPWVVLKGPVLYAQQVADLGPRPSSDLDLLVDPAGLGDAVAALESAGWRVRERNWDLLARAPFGALHLDPPQGPPERSWREAVARPPELDLHWDLVHRPSVRRTLPIPVPPILARRRRVDVGGLVVPAPDPLDLAIHVAVHAVLGGGGSLGWWVDLHRALEVAGHDADLRARVDTLRARADASGIALPVAVALDRMGRRLGPPPVSGTTPEAVLGDWSGPVGGATWRRLLDVPAPAAVTRTLTAATRATGPAGTVALLGRAASLPWRALLAGVKRTPLRRLLPLGSRIPRLFPGRALTLARGRREGFLARID